MTRLAPSGKAQSGLSVCVHGCRCQAYACHGDAMDVHPPVDIGTDFLGYRIEELIGRGGMGVVYRAYDLRLKRPVALKLVAPSLALDERFRDRFARETELVMSLEHPNVIPIYDAGDVDGRVYLAMRLVDGTDLGALLRTEGALEPARAIAICGQIASSLDVAHARGLVHRDVKPSNVLLDSSDHVYLADFGLTRRLDDQTGDPGEDRSIGTPAYLAPEQLEGLAVDGRADVYSLGCLLYECLTGEHVFPRRSRLAEAWAHLENEPPRASERMPDLPTAIDDVISRALAKEPEQRYATCTALISAAEEALGFRKARLFGRARPLILGAAMLVAVVAAVVTTAVLATGDHRKVNAPLFAGANTLARIDPATDRVSAVIDVGAWPAASAVGGHSVWVYNRDDSTISEIDARTNRKRKTTAVSGPPAGCCGNFAGPVLAADATGAWFVSASGRPLLTHLFAGARAKREYPLDVTPSGVAVGYDAVWVVGRGAHAYQLLRIDPATGRVTARATSQRPRRSILSLSALAPYGSSGRPTQPSTGSPARRQTVRTRGDRKSAGHAAAADELRGRPRQRRVHDQMGVGRQSVDPSSLSFFDNAGGSQPDWGENTSAFGSWWFDDWPTGSVYRQWAMNGPTRRSL